MFSMIPFDRFSENLETRSLTWTSADGSSSTTDVYHVKSHRSYTQIEILSRIESEYFDAMSHLEKYLFNEKKSSTNFLQQSQQSHQSLQQSSKNASSTLLRLHMYSADMIVTSTLQKQYKMLFLVDQFNSDLRTYLDKHKSDKQTFSAKTLFSLFCQIAESICSAYELKSSDKNLDITRVHLNNFVMNVSYADSIKFIHNPFIAIFDSTYIIAKKYPAKAKISYRQSNTHTYSPSNTSSSSSSTSSSFSSMSSSKLSTNKLPRQSINQTNPNSNSNSSASSTIQKQLKKDSIQNLEQTMIKDMGELFVRIATLSTEEWMPMDANEDIQSLWGTKMKKGIRQIQIKYSQQLGNLITSMISADDAERPSLRKTQEMLMSLASEASSQEFNSQIASKSVKFEPTNILPTTHFNGVRTVHVHNINNPHEKNRLLSILPPNEQCIIFINLNDPKRAFIEKIDIESNKSEEFALLNSVNHEGCRSANILNASEYEVYSFGGFKSLRTSKFVRYTTKFETKSPMLGKLSRHSFGICTVNTDIFIIGGCDGDSIVGSCEKYDTRSNTWKRLSPMNVPVHSAAVCVFNNSAIYKFGGISSDTSSPSQIVEKYEIAIDKWIVLKYTVQPAIQEQFQFIPSSIAVQINEMQILLIGGKKNTKDSTGQAKQTFLFNILSGTESYSYNYGSSYEVSDYNTLGTLQESTPVYADQTIIFNDELLFLQFRTQKNAARLLSFTSPGGIKVLRKDLFW